MKKFFYEISAIVGLCSMAAVASASVLSPADGFNVLALGNVSNSHGGQVEGRLAVGGSVDLSDYSVGAGLSDSNGTRDDLIVGESLNAPGTTVVNGNAVYNRNLGTAPATPNGTVRQQSGVFDFAGAFTQLRATSAALADLTTNAAGSSDGVTYTLTGTDAKLNVFTLDSAQATAWADTTYHQIIAPVGSTFIINFTDADVSMSRNMTLVGVDNQHVLFNFDGTTSLNLYSMDVKGSILAPDADLTADSSTIEGQAVIGLEGSFSLTTFLNDSFEGSACIPPITAIPTPAALPTGLALLGAMGMRRRRGVEGRCGNSNDEM